MGAEAQPHREPGDLASVDGACCGGIAGQAPQMLVGVGGFGDGVARRGGERFAVARLLRVGAQLVEPGLHRRQVLFPVLDSTSEAGLFGVVGGLQQRQLRDEGSGLGVFDDSGVAGGYRFHLGVVEGGLVDLLDGALVTAPREQLTDEAGLAFQRLPHVGVEAALGDIAQDLDLVELVAGSQDAALSLFDVGGPPARVEVVHGGEAGLDVDAGSGFLGAGQKHRHRPVAARREQALSVLGAVVVVDGGDLVAGDAAALQRVGEQVIDAHSGAVGARDAHVAEHHLQRSGSGVGVAGEMVGEGAVGVLGPDGVDMGCTGLDFGGVALVEADETEVQGGFAAVAGDQQHVVVAGVLAREVL